MWQKVKLRTNHIEHYCLVIGDTKIVSPNIKLWPLNVLCVSERYFSRSTTFKVCTMETTYTIDHAIRKLFAGSPNTVRKYRLEISQETSIFLIL